MTRAWRTYDSDFYHSDSKGSESDLDSLCGLAFSKKRKTEDVYKGDNALISDIVVSSSTETTNQVPSVDNARGGSSKQIEEVSSSNAVRTAKRGCETGNGEAKNKKKLRIGVQTEPQINDINDLSQSVFAQYSSVSATLDFEFLLTRQEI